MLLVPPHSKFSRAVSVPVPAVESAAKILAVYRNLLSDPLFSVEQPLRELNLRPLCHTQSLHVERSKFAEKYVYHQASAYTETEKPSSI